MACRQCTRPSPARVAVSRIEKAWLREASVSQLLARAAPVAYTNRVCAEGLHFSAFHRFIACAARWFDVTPSNNARAFP